MELLIIYLSNRKLRPYKASQSYPYVVQPLETSHYRHKYRKNGGEYVAAPAATFLQKYGNNDP